ncbi:MAG TPA: hypothetical protein VK473_12585 [Terriglobales bacterium]|nr:hypothetical protein [Terriglobales bacterium]
MKRIAQVVLLLLALLAAAAASGGATPPPGQSSFQAAHLVPPTPRRLGVVGPQYGRSRSYDQMRLGLWLAPFAAIASTLASGLIGMLAGYVAGRWKQAARALTAVLLALPWILLLLTGYAIPPLAPDSFRSVAFTLILLVQVGFLASTPVVLNAARRIRGSAFVLQARAGGQHGLSLFMLHVWPYLRPILLAQFWISLFVFILCEAGMVLLGMNLGEPAAAPPEPQNFADFFAGVTGWWSAVLVLAMVALIVSFQLLLSREAEPAS